MKVLRCRNVGCDCNQEIRGHNEEEVMRLAAEHAQTQHSIQVTPEMETKVPRHLRDESTPPLTSPTHREILSSKTQEYSKEASHE